MKFTKKLIFGTSILIVVSFVFGGFVFADSVDVGLTVTDSGGGGGGGGGGDPDPDPETDVYGCTDPLATNYNSLATISDGSCLYQQIVPNVSDFNATFNSNNNRVDLSWTNPSFAEFSSVRIIKSSSIPSDPSDGVLIYQGSGQTTIDLDITEGETYFYGAFVANTDGDFSSGAVDSVTIPTGEEEEVDDEVPGDDPGGVDDPFASFPESSSQESKPDLFDFLFIQTGERTKIFSVNSLVEVRGDKDLTVSIPSSATPAVLKAIGMTLIQDKGSDSHSFLLRIDSKQKNYVADISAGTLLEGQYSVFIHILNFQDQTVKRLNGKMLVAGAFVAEPILPIDTLKKSAKPILVTAGAGAGLLQVAMVTTKISSFYDVYLLFLRGLGALLGFLGIKRKRKPWGTVYDAVTKRPIDPAYVSVTDKKTGKEVASAITDIDGRYGFFLEPGNYEIVAGKTHYEFPSKTLAGKSEDELYGNLYFGGEAETQAGETINKNIPLDPVGFDWNEFVKSKQDFFKIHSKKELLKNRIFGGIYLLGAVVAFGSLVIDPGYLNIVIVLSYVALFVGQSWWKSTHKVVTLTKSNGESLPFAVVRAYLPSINQEVKRVVADEVGRFYMLLRPGNYYFTVEEKLPEGGYQKIFQSEPIELKKGILNKGFTV